MTTLQADNTLRYTFRKNERLCSVKLTDRLFQGGGSKAMSAFPLRMVYLPIDKVNEADPCAQVLVSVSKRHFHHAVDRNRVKRQIREAYRLNKHTVWQAMQQHMPQKQLLIAFIYIDSQHHSSHTIHTKMVSMLNRLAERIIKQGPMAQGQENKDNTPEQ